VAGFLVRGTRSKEPDKRSKKVPLVLADRLFLVIAGLLILAVVKNLKETNIASNPPADAAGTAETMLNEVGCNSKFSEEKKADIFATNYKDRVMTTTALVTKIDAGQILLKVLRSTLTYDIQVKLRDPKSGYNIEKDKMIRIRFIVRTAGGCILAFTGDDGVIED
jgi:hypothetical protein